MSTPIPVTKDATIPAFQDQVEGGRQANPAAEYNPNAPAGSEQLIGEQFTADDEQEERDYERPDANKISRASIDNLRDGVSGGGATVKSRLRGVREDPYKQERDMEEAVERSDRQAEKF